MRKALVLVLVLAACASAGAATGKLRADVSPRPASLAARTWSPTISLTDAGRPATAKLRLRIQKGAQSRTFAPRAVRRGTYRARVVFPEDGRWAWSLAAGRTRLAGGSIVVATRVGFELPYDLASAPDGTIYFLDRARVLALSGARVRVHATTTSDELVALERLADGTLFLADLPGGRVLRVDPAGRVGAVAQVPDPADLVADASGSTLWVASIAPGVGVVRVDVASGRVEPFARPENPHGIDRTPDGDFVVHDGRGVSRVDGDTGAISPFAAVDAIKLFVAPDGTVYGVEGSASGGRVVRIAPDGRVTTVVGTGFLGPHRDGPALEAEILPSSVDVAPDGALLVSQVQPVPAIRRLDAASGRLTTLVRGR